MTDMDVSSQLGAILELAESLGITIRRGPAAGDSSEHPGGALVRLKDKDILFLDPTASPTDQIDVAISALRNKREQLEGIFVPPQIRELIESDDQH